MRSRTLTYGSLIKSEVVKGPSTHSLKGTPEANDGKEDDQMVNDFDDLDGVAQNKKNSAAQNSMSKKSMDP